VLDKPDAIAERTIIVDALAGTGNVLVRTYPWCSMQS
jgi:hypothetical protein